MLNSCSVGGFTLFSLRRKPQLKGLIGISVTPEGVCLARVTRKANELPQLEDCIFKPFNTHFEPEKLLPSLVAEHRLAKTPCVEVIEPTAYNLLLVEPPNVALTELRAAVRWRIKDLIDFHIDDAIIDVFDIPGQNLAGRAKTMYVVVARSSLVRKRVDMLQGAGFNLSVIDIPELALRNITSLLSEDRSGVALLHLGAHRGQIILTRQSTLYLARNIDIGLEKLVTLMRRYAPAAEENPEIPTPELQGLLDAIVLEIQRSLDYYESHYGQAPISHLIIAPLAQPVPGLVNYLTSNLGIAVRPLDLNNLLDCHPPLSEPLQARCLLAIGAALRVEEMAL